MFLFDYISSSLPSGASSQKSVGTTFFFEERILGVAAGRTDDRGYSLADCANQIDEGGAGGPAMPGGAAGNRAQTSRRKRLKELYALLYKHELDMYQNHFQDGDGAFQYLIAVMRTPVDRLQLRELDD